MPPQGYVVTHPPLAPLSARSEATTRRTYCRPEDDEGTKFETWEGVIQRSHVEHHRKLWADVGGKPDEGELQELKGLGQDRAGLVAGRTLWLGGTSYAYSRAASQFNCSGLRLETVYDMVDAFWLLLNGCGVGGKPKAGTLHGYSRRITTLEVVPSNRPKDYKGNADNIETHPTTENGYVWTVKVGDSAAAWAKVPGKMMVSPRTRIDRLVLDFSDVRGKGGRLKGYGWICNGYEPFAKALAAIHEILNRNAGNLLGEEDIGDIFNWMGTVLSSRRAAEAMMLDADHPHAGEFGRRKRDYWLNGNEQRRQSNNSLLFWKCPSISDIADLLKLNLVGGEPGFVNAEAALRRCPWFDVFNPCFEIELPSAGFCNLVSLCLPMFGRDFARLERAVRLMARANYRQTCVDLRDDVLQPKWHQTNESLRLCGVSFTGVTQAGWLSDYHIRRLRNAAIAGAYSMADELGMPYPKAVTTIKPEGTRSKISGRLGAEVKEGIHQSLGRYVFNWINFSVDDPLVGGLEAAGYKTLPNPNDRNNVLVRFPLDFGADPTFIQDHRGAWVCRESAVTQLRRYRRWNTLWADHNVSATISFDEAEIPEMAAWIHRNWGNSYIATAFQARVDPSKTAKDLGHPYLPQEVVTEGDYGDVMKTLRPVDWDRFHHGIHELDEAGCVNGVCPTR